MFPTDALACAPFMATLRTAPRIINDAYLPAAHARRTAIAYG